MRGRSATLRRTGANCAWLHADAVGWVHPVAPAPPARSGRLAGFHRHEHARRRREASGERKVILPASRSCCAARALGLCCALSRSAAQGYRARSIHPSVMPGSNSLRAAFAVAGLGRTAVRRAARGRRHVQHYGRARGAGRACATRGLRAQRRPALAGRRHRGVRGRAAARLVAGADALCCVQASSLFPSNRSASRSARCPSTRRDCRQLGLWSSWRAGARQARAGGRPRARAGPERARHCAAPPGSVPQRARPASGARERPAQR